MVKRKKSAPRAILPEGRRLGMFLYLAVFISGGSILVLEIAAGPGDGTPFWEHHLQLDQHDWNHPRRPERGILGGGAPGGPAAIPRLFFLLMLTGAGLVALVPALRLALLPAFEASMSVRSGPLFGGIFLFAAPSLVLGMLTPSP